MIVWSVEPARSAGLSALIVIRTEEHVLAQMITPSMHFQGQYLQRTLKITRTKG